MWGRAFAAPCRRKRCPTTARLRPRLLEPRASARQAQSGTLRAAEGPSGCDRCCFEPHTSRDSWLRGDNRELPPSRSPKPFASRSRRRPSVSWGRPERQRRGRLHLGGVLRVLSRNAVAATVRHVSKADWYAAHPPPVSKGALASLYEGTRSLIGSRETTHASRRRSHASGSAIFRWSTARRRWRRRWTGFARHDWFPPTRFPRPASRSSPRLCRGWGSNPHALSGPGF
jgi:hypothetical protein